MGFLKPTGKIAKFFKTSQQYTYRKGEIILRPEDIPSGTYYVERGFIKCYSITPDGTENIYVIFQAGDIFPARWHFVEDADNKLFYEAITSVVLHRKLLTVFEGFYSSDLEAALEMQNANLIIINILARRIENLEHTKAYARVILRLLGLADGFGKKNGNKVVLDIPITHYDFAHTINMSRETASRELEQLQRKKLITEKNHIVTINDLEKLEDELEEFYLNK